MRKSSGGKDTIRGRLSAAEHPLGFDYLRLALALSVVAVPCVTTTHDLHADRLFWQGPLGVFMRLVLPMFFALSGFLVAGSLARSASLGDFLIRRALRIVPALFAEIMLSALVLGPLLTSIPLHSYFGDRQFFTYFLNAVGDVHFSLPGVFLHNPRTGLVNGSLWTMPFEGFCYLALAALAILGSMRRRGLMLLIAAAGSVVLALQAISAHEAALAPTGPFLVVCFLAGMSLFLNRDCIPISSGLAAMVALAVIALLSIPGALYLAALPLAYVTVCVGLTRPPKTIAVRGDYSYGVYLFAYPIQQACVQLSPSLRSTWSVFLVAAPLSIAYATVSWRFIERPILTRKRQIAASIAQHLAFASVVTSRFSRKRELQTDII